MNTTHYKIRYLFLVYIVSIATPLQAYIVKPKQNTSPTETTSKITDLTVTQEHKKINLRVLLQELDTTTQNTFTITSDNGFIIESNIDNSYKRAKLSNKELTLRVENDSLFLEKDGKPKKIKSNQLAIASSSNSLLSINNKSYEGILIINLDIPNKTLQIINRIDLDAYVYSVLRFESLSYWPHEMHKVQAVASRSYAVYQAIQARTKPNSTYDIKNNNFHQVYNGAHECTHLRKAVDETKNLILTYNGMIALTMFDICCGGIIPGHMKRKDIDKPYLYRPNKCIYCEGKQPYSWTHSVEKKEFWDILAAHPRLTKKVTGIGKILNVGIKEKDKAGIVHKVIINGSRKNVALTRNELRGALSPATLKSDAFSLHKPKNSNTIEIKGTGFGHHTGLCQIGARELVSRGWNHLEILNFYFPKTKVSRLKGL